GEGRHQPPGARGARAVGMAGAVIEDRGAPASPVKRRAALLSVGSNTLLILLKVVAGSVTGSVALLTEAMHSSVDLIASVVAYVSVRKADEPADESHPYGHEKIENLAAAIEGMLILVGSGVIVFESGVLVRRAAETQSAALEGDAAHLRTDALTSVGVLVGLVLVGITGAEWLDPAVALVVAGAIVSSGIRILTRSSRVLVDE